MTSVKTFGPMIYWSSRPNRLYRANLDGTGVEIVSQTLQSTVYYGGLDFDITNQKIYRSDALTQLITRSNFDGTHLEEVLSKTTDGISPMGITVVPEIDKMYWFDEGNQIFKRASLNGEMIESLFSSVPWMDDVSDVEIIVSVEGDSLTAFFSETTSVCRYVYGVNGFHPTEYLNDTDGLQNVESVAFDTKNNTLYFSDIGRDSIYAIDDPESSGAATALPLQLVGDFYGLYVDEVSEHLYFYDETHKQIVRWKIGTSHAVETILTTTDVPLTNIEDLMVVNY
jgi:hypothetical protein